MVARLYNQLKNPLVVNGYALILSSGATSVLGVGYWILAARLYPEEVVGLSSALIAMMFFLANVSQLNLVKALNRFIPSAGAETTGLVLKSYGISVVMATIASVAFLAGLELWAPSLGGLRSSFSQSAWFVGATVSWCLFALQDSVLVGLRQAKWVPLENIIYALIKLALIVIFATTMPEHGIFMSWTVPVLLLTLPVNALIFFRLIPAHIRAAPLRTAAMSTREMVRYVAGDYVSSLVWTAAIALPPLLILERLGAAASAHFYLAWNIAYALYLVSTNMGMSLVTEGSRDEGNLEHYSFETLKQILWLLVPLVAGIVVFAPTILQLYGDAYVADGAALLRLLSLSAIPYAVTSVYVSMARVQRRVRRIFFVFAALCTLVLIFATLFSSFYGVTGVGLAWLLAQSVVALVLCFTGLRRVWLLGVELPGSARTLLKFLQNVSGRRHMRRASALLPAVTGELLTRGYDAHSWQLRRLLPTHESVKVMTLGPVEREVAIFKLPVSLETDAHLTRQVALLNTLRDNPTLTDLHPLLPTVLAEAHEFPHAYLIEAKLPGVNAEVFLRNPAARELALQNAAQAIGKLHRRTAERVQVDETLLKLWVDAPLHSVARLLGRKVHRDRAQQLALELRGALLGRTVTLSWVHGDYSPQNILMGTGAEVTGIVDWETAAPRQLSVLDTAHLVLATRMLTERREFGSVLCGLLTGSSLSEVEATLMEASTGVESPPLELRTVLLLSWLQHLGGDVDQHPRTPNNPLWLAKNVESVLSCAASQYRR